jgi:hypothetical protein
MFSGIFKKKETKSDFEIEPEDEDKGAFVYMRAISMLYMYIHYAIYIRMCLIIV